MVKGSVSTTLYRMNAVMLFIIFGQSLRFPVKTVTMIAHPLKSGVKEQNELFELSFSTNLEYFAPTPTPPHNLAVLQASS